MESPVENRTDSPIDQAERDKIVSGSRKAMIWGIFLILLGGAFLLERSNYISGWMVGQLWPLVFFVIGVNHLVERRPGGAISMFLLGAWFFAVNFDWMGLTYRNSWPLVLVATGSGMVVKSLSGEDRHRRRHRRHGGAS